jgi:hypothetical protein
MTSMELDSLRTNLRIALWTSKVSRSEFAKAMGVTPHHLNGWINGHFRGDKQKSNHRSSCFVDMVKDEMARRGWLHEPRPLEFEANPKLNVTSDLALFILESSLSKAKKIAFLEYLL